MIKNLLMLGIMAGLLSRFLPHNVVQLLVGVSAVYIMLSLAAQWLLGPLPPILNKAAWVATIALIFTITTSYVEQRHPRVAAAMQAAETYFGFKWADSIDPKYPAKLAEGVFDTEMNELLREQDYWFNQQATVDAEPHKMDGGLTESQRARVNDAKAKLADIDRRMQQVNLARTKGGRVSSNNTGSSASFGSHFGFGNIERGFGGGSNLPAEFSSPVIDVLHLGLSGKPEHAAMQLKPSEMIQVHISTNSEFNTSLKEEGCSVQYIFADGRRINDAYGKVVNFGSGAKNRLFRVRNSGEGACTFIANTTPRGFKRAGA